jgi:outer membrane protein OmpA-like peptidoglycan-associated protein
VALRRDRIAILEQVHFANDRDVILPESFELLGQVARVLAENPWVSKVRVEGHTDSKGSAKHNLDLSERRARSVRRWLVRSGVAPERLAAKGYGPSRPIDRTDTAAGRRRNRRVEFVILAQEPPQRP